MLLLLFTFFAQTLFSQDANLSLEEKIGQLFIVPAKSSEDGSHLKDLTALIDKYHIGSVILKQGDPLSQIKMIQQLQESSKIPLLCVQDAEWGLSMRLANTVKFPKNLTLGAIQDNTLIFKLGKEIGKSCKKVGVHVNLAPVVDFNSNPKNPVIHTRSFGADPNNVAAKAIAYMQGMHSEGVLACAKHFPGHGDTSADSHVELPLANKIELFPFQQMIQAGSSFVMTAHLSVPALDTLPVTFSSKIVTDLLKKKMGFQGFVITDALNMRALTNSYSPNEIGLRALLAGHDLLLYGDHIAPNIHRILTQDVPQAFERIREAVLDGTILEQELDEHVNKILQLKKSLNFTLSTENVLEEINSEEAKALKRQLYRSAVTLVSDPENILPLSQDRVTFLSDKESLKDCDTDTIVLSLYEKPTEEILSWIQKTKEKKKVIIVLFQSPYSLSYFDKNITLIEAYENDPDAEEAVRDVIFGNLEPVGKLPITF